MSIISTDEDPSLRIESSAIINLRGVSTKLNKYIVFTMQTYKKLKLSVTGSIISKIINGIGGCVLLQLVLMHAVGTDGTQGLVKMVVSQFTFSSKRAQIWFLNLDTFYGAVFGSLIAPCWSPVVA